MTAAMFFPMVSLGGVHDDGGLGLPSAGDLLLSDSDSDLHGLGSHHDLGQVVNVLGVQFGHDLHSGDKSVVDHIERAPLFDGLGDDGSNGLEPHVHDFLGDLVENGVCREQLLSHLLGSHLDLKVDVVALQDFAEISTFATKHSISSAKSLSAPHEASYDEIIFSEFHG